VDGWKSFGVIASRGNFFISISLVRSMAESEVFGMAGEMNCGFGPTRDLLEVFLLIYLVCWNDYINRQG